MLKGRIINVNAGKYVLLDELNNEITCKASGRLRYVSVSKNSKFNYSLNKKSTKTSSNIIKISPKVGDLVIYENKEGTNYIIEVLERKNDLIRPDISNVDQVLLVFASKKPDFSSLLLDMFLVNLEKEFITPYIIISKVDLLSKDEFDELYKIMQYYKSIGYDYIFVNSHNLVNKEEINDRIKNKISCVSGQTGAGKSSLINALIPGFKLNTQEISLALGRGKHTTREINLYRYNDGLIGDTPGFSKLDLSNIDKYELGDYFIEFKKFNCKFSNCTHEANVKGCGVYDAYINGYILKSRYNNYLKMLKEIKEKEV